MECHELTVPQFLAMLEAGWTKVAGPFTTEEECQAVCGSSSSSSSNGKNYCMIPPSSSTIISGNCNQCDPSDQVPNSFSVNMSGFVNSPTGICLGEPAPCPTSPETWNVGKVIMTRTSDCTWSGAKDGLTITFSVLDLGPPITWILEWNGGTFDCGYQELFGLESSPFTCCNGGGPGDYTGTICGNFGGGAVITQLTINVEDPGTCPGYPPYNYNTPECVSLTPEQHTSYIESGWTHVSGPYDSEDECSAACLSSSGSSSSGITTECCSNPIPTTLSFTANLTGVVGGNCDSGSFSGTLTYNSSDHSWEYNDSFTGYSLTLQCQSSPGPEWIVALGSSPTECFGSTTPDSVTCDPFFISTGLITPCVSGSCIWDITITE